MSVFPTIENEFVTLSVRTDHQRLQLSEVSDIPAVAVVVGAPNVLPVGEPDRFAPPVRKLAHLLGERGDRGVAIAVVPGTLAAEFGAAYRNGELEFWAAPDGPTDVLPLDSARPHLPLGTGGVPAVDPMVRVSASLQLDALFAAREHVRHIRPMWERDDLTKGRWARLREEFVYGERQVQLWGALACTAGGRLVYELGYSRGGQGAISVSWLVSRAVGSRRWIRFSGPQVKYLFGGVR